MIKAVIFDLDGVLVDTEALSREANRKVMKEYGTELTQEEKRKAIGRPDLEIFRDALEARGLDLKPEELTREKDRIYLELIKGRVRPLPGAREILERLKEKGIPFAIASSGTPAKIRGSLTETGLIGLINTIVSANDISRGKPYPDIFLKAAEKLGMEPGDCLVVEDAEAGIEAAKAAGMRCIALKSPNTFGQDFSKADMILDSLKEVEEEL